VSFDGKESVDLFNPLNVVDTYINEAVELRHHCVHRASYDKDGNEVTITAIDIEKLIGKCSSLVHTS